VERPKVDKPDLSEKGGLKDGQPQSSDQRLFMQLQIFTGCNNTRALIDAVAASNIEGVLYEDVNDPFGVAMLTFSQDPLHFVTKVRTLFQDDPFNTLTLQPEMTMMGRTYSLGYEPDLNETLLARPRRTALSPAWNWAIWYPLRRSGAFLQLAPEQQKDILREHGAIGMSFGAGDYAHDIRLACQGLDIHDNDFVIGLTGKDLFPLSAIVQAMRKTTQTAQYLTNLGPFFVGHAVWKSPL
jgi:chlorite dismutase